jgi:outer membrane protein assembly factor BamD (BamD/ComL family)
MRQNIRISKREMKEDKFTTFMLVAKDYVLENWIYFVGGVAAVIVVVVAIVLLGANRTKGAQQAQEIFNRALGEYRSGSYQLAVVDFKTIIDEYGSTPHAREAAFDLGNAYFAARNFADAKTAFENYLAKYTDDKFFVTSAMAGVGASLAGLGNYKEAADKYREAAEKYPDFKPSGQYYLKALEYYIKAGEKESARVIYAKLAKDYKSTQYYIDGARLATENNIKL